MEIHSGFNKHMTFPSIILVILSRTCDSKGIYPSIIHPSIYENTQACFSCMPAHLVTLTAAEQRKHLGNLGQSRALSHRQWRILILALQCEDLGWRWWGSSTKPGVSGVLWITGSQLQWKLGLTLSSILLNVLQASLKHGL